MNLRRLLFGAVAASPVKPRTLPNAGDGLRIVRIRLESAHLVLEGGLHRDVQADGPICMETTPDGVLITDVAHTQGSAPICRLEIPEGATVDLELASGGLTVRNLRGVLRARVLSGGVSVQNCEGRFNVVAPDGRVAFDGVGGEVDILTNNGAVTARQIHGGLHAVSTGGAMAFDDISGPIAARTLNGSIHATDMRGPARLSTRSGAVHVSGECAQLKVRTQSGDITLDCSIVAHTTLETLKGNLELKLGPQTNAHLEALASQGVVRTERISPLPGSTRRRLRSQVGPGQSRLRLASGAGVINVAGPPRVSLTPPTGAAVIPRAVSGRDRPAASLRSFR